MSPAEIATTLEALTGIAQILERLGISGLIALALSGPVLVLIAVLIIEYHRSRKTQELMTMSVESMRSENRATLETYRADTQNLLRELGANQRQTDTYYRDNVELVRGYELVASNLQDVVVSNTRAMERLITILEERRSNLS